MSINFNSQITMSSVIMGLGWVDRYTVEYWPMQDQWNVIVYFRENDLPYKAEFQLDTELLAGATAAELAGKIKELAEKARDKAMGSDEG